MRKKVWALVLAGVMMSSLAACGSGSTETGGTPVEKGSSAPGAAVSAEQGEAEDGGFAWDPYTPYAETVTFTKGVQKLTNVTDYTYESNPYTSYVKEKFNIETKVAWEVDSNNYDQKVSLSIAAGDIPDIMVVNRKIYNQLRENDLIQDMTKAYDQCISPFLREQFESAGERLFQEVTVDGQMMGIPSPSLGYCHNVLWIRKDWLDKLGMEPPKTAEDVVNLAKAFVEQDPGGNGPGNTVGLTGLDTVYGGYNTWGGLDTMFSAYGAYPGSWILQDGEPVYGSTMEGMKPALQNLADMYKNGLLDKEFAIRKGEDRDALIASGKLGLFFSVWWPGGGLTAAVENNPEADWIAVSAPVNGEGKLTTPENDPLQAILVVRKGYEHPEAIVKALNGGYDILRGNGDGEEAYKQWNEEVPDIGWGMMPIPIEVNYFNIIDLTLKDIENALAAGSADAMTIKGYAGDFERIQYNRAHPKEDISAYLSDLARISGPKAAMDSNVEFIPSAFYGTTDTMATKWTNLKKLETETLLQIIMGEQSVDAFDKFVEQWYAMGGQEIIDEIKAERNQ